jgi:hypothetical protein
MKTISFDGEQDKLMKTISFDGEWDKLMKTSGKPTYKVPIIPMK